jgi:hypothetical protein
MVSAQAARPRRIGEKRRAAQFHATTELPTPSLRRAQSGHNPPDSLAAQLSSKPSFRPAADGATSSVPVVRRRLAAKDQPISIVAQNGR